MAATGIFDRDRRTPQVRLEEDDKDLYATKMTDAFFDEWQYR